MIFSPPLPHLVLPIAVLSLFLSGCRKPEAQGGRPRAAMPVLVATVERQDTPIAIDAIGRVIPLASVSLKPQVTGQISEVHFKEGQEVKAGDLLFTIEKRPFEVALARAQAALDQARASFRNAERQAERYTELSQRGAVAKEQFDQVKLNRETGEAAVKAAEAALETANLELGYCAIHAPISGRTGRRLVDPGNVVSANVTDLAVINQIEPIQIAFPVAERFLGDLKRYLAEGSVMAKATPEGTSGGFEEGPVTFLDNTVKVGSGTVELKAVFANANRLLWPGQFARVALTLTVERGVVVVPGNAVQNGQGGAYVFIVKDGKAEYRPVTVARSAGNLAVIAKGLEPGESVVLDGQSRLSSGTPVDVKSSLLGASQP